MEIALPRGAVLFVPAAQEAALGQTGNFDPSDPSAMTRASFELTAERLQALGGSAATITDGRFPLNGTGGNYVVCLADSFADHTPGPPYSVVGCARVNVAEGASITVSFGEAGVQAKSD
jgi:hypothetical protein